MVLSIHPFTVITHPALRVEGLLEPLPAILGRRWGFFLQVFVICAQKGERKPDESYDPKNPLIIALHLGFTFLKKKVVFYFCLKSNDNI